MAEPPTGTPSRPSEDRLDSWKEIATYLRRDITTVQRWEKRESMPVHRHLHDKQGSVYAFRSELDSWIRLRQAPATEPGELEQTPSPPVSVEPPRRRWIVVAGSIAVVVVIVAVGLALLSRGDAGSSRRELTDARVESVTDFDGLEQAASISPDGRFAAFLSERDGRTDVWLTRIGSGQFHNLTAGSAPELVNPSVRTLGFTPDGDSVTYWMRRPGADGTSDIGIWSVPIVGGTPSPYLNKAAEFAWTRDGSRLVYHTTGPGDPMFVTGDLRQLPGTPIFTAPAGRHAHFPIWSPDAKFIYFVQGSLPDTMDIWRMTAAGTDVERMTNHNSRVSHPVFVDAARLVYLATDSDGRGPWLYELDVQTRAPRRLLAGADRFTSLAASSDGNRLVVTVAHPKRTLWRLPLRSTEDARPSAIDLSSGTGFSPRFGSDYLVHVSSVGGRDRLLKIAGSVSTELWSAPTGQIVGAPAISSDRRRIAFSARVDGKTALYVVSADGSELRVVTDALRLAGSPAWTPDGRFITSAADDGGTPKLANIPLDGSNPVPLVHEYSTDPSWSPDGRILLYSGPDIGTTFTLKSMAVDGSTARSIPPLTLTRGSRHVAFFPERHTVVFLRGEIEHKDLWAIDLDTGKEIELSRVPAEFTVTDFDVSPDGGEIVLERSQDNSHIALLEFSRKPR
ncbi:MAG TPA: hypothetical protein VH583_24415 [Vicinamibacterales bacterium]|jgi:Tol biopolymer transport system component